MVVPSVRIWSAVDAGRPLAFACAMDLSGFSIRKRDWQRNRRSSPVRSTSPVSPWPVERHSLLSVSRLFRVAISDLGNEHPDCLTFGDDGHGGEHLRGEGGR